MSTRPEAGEAVLRAHRLADEVLFPAATATDRAALLPLANLDALAGAGLYGVTGPAEAGGLAGGPEELRAVIEAVAGGCLTTCFVWIQHLGTVPAVAYGAPADVRAEWLVPLCTGAVRSGVAFAHLRRPGPPVLRAVPDGDGWRLHGTTPWITGWGRIDVVHVAAWTDDGRVVWALLDAEAAGGLSVEPLELAAIQASGTVRARFDAVRVPAARVTTVEDGDTWRARDAAGLATNGALGLGVAHRAVRLLAGGHPVPAAALNGELDRLRAALGTAAPDALPGVRAGITDLAVRAASALVAAGGGATMDLGHHAQRLLREAAFLLVQGQTSSIRQAQLALLTRHTP